MIRVIVWDDELHDFRQSLPEEGIQFDYLWEPVADGEGGFWLRLKSTINFHPTGLWTVRPDGDVCASGLDLPDRYWHTTAAGDLQPVAEIEL